MRSCSPPAFNAELSNACCIWHADWGHFKTKKSEHRKTWRPRLKLLSRYNTSTGFSICSIPFFPPLHHSAHPTWAFSSFTWARWLPCFAFTADQLGILVDCTLWHLSGWHRKLTWRRLDMPSGRHLRSLPWRLLLLSHLLVNVLCCWKQWQLLGVMWIYTSLGLNIMFLSPKCFWCFELNTKFKDIFVS